jgi:hypothetical protein
LRSGSPREDNYAIVEPEPLLSDLETHSLGELQKPLEFSPVMPTKPNLPPDRLSLSGIDFSGVSPESLQRCLSKRSDPVHHVLVTWLALFCRFLRVLLKALEEMPQRAVRDENRAKLDDGLLRTTKGHQFNAPPSILQRFQFQVDAWRTLELNIETRLCSMDSNVGSRAPCLRFGLCLSQGVAKSSCVTLAVGWASVWRPLDLSKMRRVRVGGRCRWNEEVLAISRGWH